MPIDISKLSESDVGAWVIYTSAHGEREEGRIKSWNAKHVFVVYKCAGNWMRYADYTAAATDPSDLEFSVNQGGRECLKN